MPMSARRKTRASRADLDKLENNAACRGRGRGKPARAQSVAAPIRAEIRQDLAALSAFVAAHGSFADMVREHYAAEGDAPV